MQHHLQDYDNESREGVDTCKKGSSRGTTHMSIYYNQCLDKVKHRGDKRVGEKICADVAQISGAHDELEPCKKAVSLLCVRGF